jgi:hypothetical protein
MTSKNLKEFNQITIDFQNKVINNYAWVCCLNCKNFNAKADVCTLYKQRPPTNVVVVGCVEYFPLIAKG